ncbi:MAG: hypothetical protein NUV77_20865 [Thermoguttaceae bacterium]|jgi:hypothetical protein|nr:hypothetical protein [Thermoguttaceae bacterium]
MNEPRNGALRRVAWSELFPWLIIARCFRIAIQFRLLLAGALGTVLTLAGWSALALAFLGQRDLPETLGAPGPCPWLAAAAAIPEAYARPTPKTASEPAEAAARDALPGPREPGARTGWAVASGSLVAPLGWAWDQVARPFRQMFAADVGFGDFVFFLCCGLWALAVWSFFGGMINRAAVYELATRERLGLGAVVRFALGKWGAYAWAPLVPLLGIFVASLPVMVLGLFLRVSLGVVLAALVWPLALLAGFLLALLAIGLLFGWPLLWSGVSSEGTDTYDAIGRAYSYTYQRPLHYLFYAAVAFAIGTLGWVAVSWFFAAIVRMTYWAASWGAGLDAVARVATPGEAGGVAALGAGLVRFWTQCVRLLGAGFLASYFWSAAAAVYLLLRRHVDATEMDEVFVAEEPSQLPAPLPEIKTDSAGAPVLDPKPEDQE